MDEEKIRQLDEYYASAIENNRTENPDVNHQNADDALCELLSELGCLHTIEAFRSVEKWYA